jgi:hypothetical protein
VSYRYTNFTAATLKKVSRSWRLLQRSARDQGRTKHVTAEDTPHPGINPWAGFKEVVLRDSIQTPQYWLCPIEEI